jgi:putative transposase
MKDCKAKTAGKKPALKIAHRNDQAAVRHWLAGNGQALLPMLELVENAQASIDELMNEAARGLIEQLLVLSAQELAGAKLRGRADGDVLWHGMQRGQVTLAERKLRITHPRLRSKATSKEVAVPAYERLTGDSRMAARVRDILVAGVSTRKYESVLPEVAGTVGVSKSSVSRRMVQASAEQLRALNERSLKDLKLLAIYIDGIVVDAHHVVGAIGVDEVGDKHLLGLAAGSSENTPVVKDLLGGLVERGLEPQLAYLFVIDGSKALRSAIGELFGERAHVQRCRTHKLRNVLERLPKEQRVQTKAVMNAAFKLEAKAGMDKLRQQAKWLQAEHADAAASLLEGIEEMFTVNRLGLPPTLMRCLTTTNIIENPNGIVRSTTQRVKRWRDQDMALRWTAAGFLEAEKSFRKVLGFKELWILRVALGRDRAGAADAMKKAA